LQARGCFRLGAPWLPNGGLLWLALLRLHLGISPAPPLLCDPVPTPSMTSQPSRDRVAVITGPSGVGKGTLVRRLLERHPEIWLSISATTRSPRQGEQDGRDYFFRSRQDFEQCIADGDFLEWAEFAGNLYGTPRQSVERNLEQGPVLLEIELEGARQVRQSFPAALQIFLAPPSFEELERRIRSRGTDSETAIARRLERAREELAAAAEFDAVLVNGDLEEALLQLERLLGLA
jgi:guanylate kinase